MNTTFMLMAQYNKAVVKLEDVSKEYFGIGKDVAFNKAKAGQLPVPAFRAGNSNKAPWMINLSDLGAHLDKCRDAVAAEQVA